MNTPTFISQLAWEFRLQRKYFMWTVAVVVTLVWLSLLLTLSDSVKSLWLPILIFADLGNIGLLFIAGLLFLERRQGTLYALAVLPVPRSQWLFLKLLSLSLLTTFCAVAIVLFSGSSPHWGLLIPATLLNAALFTLCGLLLALPFDKLLNYFLGMVLLFILLNLPMLDYFGVFSHWLLWIIPTEPALWLLAASFDDVSMSFYVLCLVMTLAWIVALYLVGVRQFRRYIAMRPQS